jgi:hypothetical protein
VWVEEDGMTFTRWMLAAACGLPAAAPAAQVHLDRIRLPPGFHIETYATGVINAREMCLSPSGTLFVSTRREGNVYALQDTKKQARRTGWSPSPAGCRTPTGWPFARARSTSPSDRGCCATTTSSGTSTIRPRRW